MAENDNTKIIEDSDLDKVAGGLSIQDYENAINGIAAALRGAGTVLGNLSDVLQLIKTSMDTNTCPICNQKIVPLAENCELMDLINHIKIAHKNPE